MDARRSVEIENRFGFQFVGLKPLLNDVEVGVIQKDRIQIRSGLEQGQTVVCRAR